RVEEDPGGRESTCSPVTVTESGFSKNGRARQADAPRRKISRTVVSVWVRPFPPMKLMAFWRVVPRPLSAAQERPTCGRRRNGTAYPVRPPPHCRRCFGPGDRRTREHGARRPGNPVG